MPQQKYLVFIKTGSNPKKSKGLSLYKHYEEILVMLRQPSIVIGTHPVSKSMRKVARRDWNVLWRRIALQISQTKCSSYDIVNIG